MKTAAEFQHTLSTRGLRATPNMDTIVERQVRIAIADVIPTIISSVSAQLSGIRDHISELEKGMLIKTKQIAILEAKVAELREPPRLVRYACHGCEAECRTSAYDSTEIKTKCPYPIWEEVQE